MTEATRARLERRVARVDAGALRHAIRVRWLIAVILTLAGVRWLGVLVLVASVVPLARLLRQQWALGRLLADEARHRAELERIPVADLRLVIP
jgi:hypothetical protein